LAILISFDIDGTLEVGDPPGELTMEMVRIAQSKGIIIGSCSDRPPSSQRRIWDDHNIQADFVCAKHRLVEDVKNKFDAEAYWHIGDREDLDRQMSLRCGFQFLWPHEAAQKPWFKPNGA
jgi:hydroxymethylpyrimidine pyrophosphatase-like HAD family hydrolase